MPRTRGVSWFPLIATPRQPRVRELLQPGEHLRERSVGGPRVVEHVAEPEEPVGLQPDRLVDRPGEGAEEVLLAHVAPLVVAEVREVRAAEVRVAERDEARHQAPDRRASLGESLRRRPQAAVGAATDPATDFR